VIIGSMFMSGLAAFPIVFLPSQPILAGVLLGSSSFALSAAAVVYNVNQVSFRQAITPLDMQGRMNATMRFIVWGVMPIGSVLGGLLGSVLPLRLTILLGAILSSTAFVWVLASPVRSLRDIPKASRSDAVASD
jgi:MFS family permease